ncbi:hypothetical protein [Streptomyces sp. NPDC020681]|uniref:hypothetical protein n=1 Tax=Streptomyces sp. NPDC020681 TaxID=3365083 RepID=UPI0037B25919
MTGDLESNAKEQERISIEIDALQEQLRALQQDHTVLVNVQQALGSGSVAAAERAAEAETAAAPSMPQQASAEAKQGKPMKTATIVTKTASTKTGANPSKADGKPTLVDLIRNHLAKQSEPHSAAEISSALAQTHPDRTIKITVVRTTLEGQVAKSHVQRTKQGSSVFYSTAATSEPSEAKPQPEAVAG